MNGEIKLDSEKGKKLGFTSDLFSRYLWERDGYIFTSFIISKNEGKGNLRKLFETILKAGFGIKVPTPFPRMEAICKKLGFRQTMEWSKELKEGVEIYVKEVQNEPRDKKHSRLAC